MSTAPPPTDIEVEDDAPDQSWRTDGSTPLDFRTSFEVLFNDPAARGYTFTALGALAMIFLILFQQGSDLGGLLIVIIGVAGVLMRWSKAPMLLLLVLTYFMWTPYGVPGDGYENRWEIEESRFRIVNVMLVLAVLVYMACQFRLFGLVSQAMAYEGAVKRKGEPPTRRPPSLIRPSELGVMFAVAAVLVVFGHVIWWLVNVIEVTPAEDFPFRMGEGGRSLRGYSRDGELPPGFTRFVLLIGILFFGFIVGRLVFGYWRLRMLGPAEGGMILLDGGWSETSRERSRLEKWRVWGRKRAETQAQKQDRTKPGEKR